jgi:hypothetical protein
MPFLGERVQEAAGAWYAQQLAPTFLDAWEDAERESAESEAAG